MNTQREKMKKRLENAKVGDVILGYKSNDCIWISKRKEKYRYGYRTNDICSVYKDGVIKTEALFPLADNTMKMVLDALER